MTEEKDKRVIHLLLITTCNRVSTIFRTSDFTKRKHFIAFEKKLLNLQKARVDLTLKKNNASTNNLFS